MQNIYTVAQLTAEIREILENRFAFIWVSGEVSNFRIPTSGHYYFTLKDDAAQISAVMFKGQTRALKFTPEDGMNVIALGRISVYEPRGTYQIILEYLEPKGVGALQLAFEQLKSKLAAEGLFDEAHKKLLPFLPKTVAVITSPTGAVIHDILTVIRRRFDKLHIRIFPVRVQGEGAATEIAEAIKLLNLRGDADVAILARGGGSSEDLSAFNTEIVARAIFASKIPIVSAVGHETDVTIADFAADLRAPTPSAAAELVVPIRDDLKQISSELEYALKAGIFAYIGQYRKNLENLSKHLIYPKKNIQNLRLRLDELSERLASQIAKNIAQKREQLLRRSDKLDALSPLSVLSRGYSITRKISDSIIVKYSDEVNIGDKLEILLAKGSLNVRVEGKT